MDLKFSEIEQYNYVDEQIFENIQGKSIPALLKNCNFGDCMSKWSLKYLDDKLHDQQIVIHESEHKDLDFLRKNFQYKTCQFSEFARKLQDPSSHVYLRSTNKDPRAKKPTKIEEDFPMLKDDLKPPSFIPYGVENKLYHSSVLRVASSDIQVWTHFDLYDNVLCQVVGTKRVVLLPPNNIRYLYVQGDKSLVNNFDNLDECLKLYPLIKNSKLYKCILKPGDALYIPALWWHNIRTIPLVASEEGYSIGFNIFWKDKLLDQDSKYADRDVYGNRNLPSYDAALANLDKALSHLDKLPPKYSQFHKLMLLERLKSKINETLV